MTRPDRPGRPDSRAPRAAALLACLAALLAVPAAPGAAAGPAPRGPAAVQDAAAQLAQAERLHARGSWEKASAAYAALDLEALSPTQRRLVRARRADCRWRSATSSEAADRSELEGARTELLALIEETERVEDRDEAWIEATESLADSYWLPASVQDFGNAWPFYRNALEHWAASSDLEAARRRYLDLVFRAAEPPHAQGNYWRVTQVPLEVLENARRIAVERDDRSRAVFYLAYALRQRGHDARGQRRLRALFDEALDLGPGAAWYDDALWTYALWLERAGRTVVEEDGTRRVEADYPAALVLYRRLVAEFGEGESAWRDNAERQIERITAPELSAAVGHTFLPGSEVEVHLRWRNVAAVELALYPVDLLADVDLQGKTPVGYWLDTIALEGRAPRVTWRHATGDDGRHAQGQARISPPAAGGEPGLPVGAYVLVAQAAGRTVRELVLVSDAALVVSTGARGAGVAYACDAVTGAPLEDAELRLWTRDRPEKLWAWTATSPQRLDAPGTFSVELPAADGSTQFLVLLRRGGRQALALGNAWLPHRGELPWKIHVATDRPAYRPEDTARFKVVARTLADGAYATPAGAELGYRIVGPRGDEVAAGTLTLSAFGGADGELALAPEMALGEYRVEFTAGNRGVGGATLFRLEEYRLPEFRVSVETPRDEDGVPRVFRPGDAVEADVVVEYYAGGAVADAECVVEVLQRPWRAVWPVERAYPWLYEDAGESLHRRGWGPVWRGQPVHRDTLTTDAEGRATVRFEVPDGLDGDFEYEVVARVTDASRRQVEGRGSVRTARQGHFVQARVEHPLVRPGDEVEATFRATDANDRPVQVSGRVQVLRRTWRPTWRTPRGRVVAGAELDRVRAGAASFPPPGWEPVRDAVDDEVVLSRLLATDAEGEARLAFTPERAGHYLVRWRSQDDEGLPVEAEATVWVGDRDTTELGYRHGGLKLVLDETAFRRGRAAPVMVVTPSADRWVLLSVEADGLLEWRLVHVTGTVALVELDVDARWEPNVHLTAVMVADGEATRDRVEVVVPPEEHYLDVAVDLGGHAFEPGGATRARVTVTDRAGEPVAAEVALAVYDEAVLAIQPEYAPDPREFFFGTKRGPGTTDASSFHRRRYARLVRGADGGLVDERFAALEGPPEEDFEELAALGYVDVASRGLAQAESAAGADFFLGEGQAKLGRALDDGDGTYRGPGDTVPPGGGGGAADEVVVRSDFRATALWSPAVVTGPDGTAEVDLEFPESLTSWRAVARTATAGDAFGQAASTARTRLPLMCRLQAPRFLVVGDACVVSAVLQNATGGPLRATVALAATGLRVDDAPEQAVDVPAGGTARVDWRAALEAPGEVVLEATARAGELADAVRKLVPGLPHGIEQSLTEAGVLRGDAVTIALDLPPRRPGSTALVVRVTPGLAEALLDSLPYLLDYPYGCTEQTMSRFVPAVAVAHALTRLGVDVEELASTQVLWGHGTSPDRSESPLPDWTRVLATLDEVTAQGLQRLTDFQHADGGWGWWEKGDSDAFMTAYVAWGLALARDAGVDVDAGMLQRAARWLDRELVEAERRPDLQAWMLHALVAVGGEPPKHADAAVANLWGRKDALNAVSRAVFALALHARGDAERAAVLAENLANGVRRDASPDTSIVQVGGGASAPYVLPTARWGDDAIARRGAGGGVESTAFVLRALQAIHPGSELIEPAVHWLVRNRRGARWNNTRDTAVAVLALVDRLEATGAAGGAGLEVEVNGSWTSAVTWSGEGVLGAPAIEVPADVLRDGANTVALRRTGGERPLYFSVEASFFSLAEPVESAGYELFVRRRYVRLVPRDTLLAGPRLERVPLADGEPLESGDRVEVVLTLEAKNELEYLLIEDLKPAGLEPLQVRSGEWMAASELRADALERRLAGALPEPGDLTGRRRGVHQELRDRQVAFFLDHCPQGFWELRYELRAETPGSFHALPVLGEAMYVPEIRANGREARIVVVDAP